MVNLYRTISRMRSFGFSGAHGHSRGGLPHLVRAFLLSFCFLQFQDMRHAVVYKLVSLRKQEHGWFATRVSKPVARFDLGISRFRRFQT